MALAEVARFWDLTEAQIARSALEAAGIDIVIFDDNWASVVWTEQAALRGIRLMAQDTDVAEAKALLQAIRPAPPPAEAAEHRDGLGRAGGAAWTLALAAVFGWPLAGLRRTTLFHRVAAILLMLVPVLTIAGFVLARLNRR